MSLPQTVDVQSLVQGPLGVPGTLVQEYDFQSHNYVRLHFLRVLQPERIAADWMYIQIGEFSCLCSATH